MTDRLSEYLLGEHLPIEICDAQTGEILVPTNRRIKKFMLRKVAKAAWREIESKGALLGFEIDPSPIRERLRQLVANFQVEYEKRHGDLT